MSVYSVSKISWSEFYFVDSQLFFSFSNVTCKITQTSIQLINLTYLNIGENAFIFFSLLREQCEILGFYMKNPHVLKNLCSAQKFYQCKKFESCLPSCNVCPRYINTKWSMHVYVYLSKIKKKDMSDIFFIESDDVKRL